MLPIIGNDFVNHLLRGSAWMIGTRWAMRSIGLVSTMILARLLAPGDFGLIAMVMLAYALLETITYAGVDLALMRASANSRAHYDTAWTVQILQGALIMVGMLLAAPVIASYFSEPRAVAVIFFVAPRALIEGFQNIGIVAFRKELDFAKEFRFTLYNKLLNFVFIVAAALWFRNYWALVWGSMTACVIGVAMSYRMHPYRPKLSLAKIGEIWSFSQWLMISRVGSFLNRKCDEFLVGGHVGATAMGNYHVASDLATLPTTEFVMPVRRAMFPTLTKIADRPDEFGAAVLGSFSAIAVICLFVSFSLLTVASEFVLVVLGAQWSSAIALIRWLSLFGGFSALVLVLEVPLWVNGRTKLSAAQSWLELAVVAPAAWIGVREYGVEGAAAARAGVAVCMLPVMMMLTARTGAVTLRQQIAALVRPLFAAIAMAAIILSVPLGALPPLFWLCGKLALCLTLYPIFLLSLWMFAGRPAGPEALVFARIKAFGASLVSAIRRKTCR